MSSTARRPENVRMQQFLAARGIVCTPKYIRDGSLRGSWRLYNKEQHWNTRLAATLNGLGFTNIFGKQLDLMDGNGGCFSVFVRGHNELLGETLCEVFSKEVVTTPGV